MEDNEAKEAEVLESWWANARIIDEKKKNQLNTEIVEAGRETEPIGLLQP